MLTQHWTVKSITDIPTLSPHKQQPASQTPHPDSSTSNATQTQLHTVAAETRHSALTHEAEDGTNTPTLLQRSRHVSVRSLERYARPSVDAVARHVAQRDPLARHRTGRTQ
jgi:hypothetical protein